MEALWRTWILPALLCKAIAKLAAAEGAEMQMTCLKGDPIKNQFLHELVGGLPSRGRRRRLLHVPRRPKRQQLNGGGGDQL